MTSKPQARKGRRGACRRLWIIRMQNGFEYEAYCHNRDDARAMTRSHAVGAVAKIYRGKGEKWQRM